MSLMDRLRNASTALFKEPVIINPNISNVMKTDRNRNVGHKKEYIIGKLSAQTCRVMAMRCPLFVKGSFKRTGDIFNNWIDIVDKDGAPLKTHLQNIVDEFTKRTALKEKMFIAGVGNDIYGDILLERTFMRKVGNKYFPIVENPSTKPNLKDEPLNINVINPEYIREIKKVPMSRDTTEYYWTTSFIESNKYIHPDRLIHKSEIKLPYSKFGISKVDIGYNIINALMNTDEISGEILDWFSTGMYAAFKPGMTSDEQDDIIKQFQEHPRFIAVDREFQIEVHNPTRIDPEPFYEHYYTKVAALFRMPRQLLIGAEVGAITGSEVGFADYVASIYSLRELYGGILEDIYKQLFESKGHEWKYQIIFNKTYIDELSESKTLEKRALVAGTLVDRNIITREEARKIINEGSIRLNIDNPYGEFIKPDKPTTPILPNVEPTKPKEQPSKKEERKAKERELDEESLDIFDMTLQQRESALQNKRFHKEE